MRHSRRFFSLLLVLLVCISASAQRLTLGPQGLVNARARSLRDPTTLTAGLRSYDWLTRVGGVAFDQTASPAKGLRFSSLTFDYRPERKNGRRFVLLLDGQEVSAPIYDWQLIPIAKFADSQYNACFTLFGDLYDAARQGRVQASGGYVLGYHPAFENTLMGLRLLQLDSLIIHPFAHELIKGDKGYIRGAGEAPPNVEANKAGKIAFERFFLPIGSSNFLGGSQQIFTSYVISDQGRRITFDVKKGSLSMTGQPSYYFWANQRLARGNARAQPVDRLSTQVSRRTDLLRAINPAVWDTGVILMRYAAFFRYYKQNYQEHWRSFMTKINSAPPPIPRVTTPAIMEPLP